jgi:hypothetical protein
MKILETHEFYNSDHKDASQVNINLTTNEGTESISIGEGEKEDMYLFRDLSDVYNITSMLKSAYDAGKNGENFEYEFIEER